jgi:hypothetical protein
MNIPEDQVLGVNMVYATTELPKDGDCLSQAKVSFAKRFPAGDVVR